MQERKTTDQAKREDDLRDMSWLLLEKKAASDAALSEANYYKC
jgi:hypothetical protein